LYVGSATSQDVSCRSLATEAPFLYQAIAREICGGRNDTGTGNSPTTSAFLVYIFPSVLHTHLKTAINVSKSTAIIFARTGRRFIQPRPVTLFGNPIECVDRTRYLGVTLDTRLAWSPHIDQVRKRTAQRMGMLGPLLNRKSDFSVRNGVLLYKQLIRPMMDYACLVWRFAARSHVRRLQVLQSKCLRLATGASGT
jgi:hypothetical protein